VSSTPYDVLIVGCGNIAGGFDMARAPNLPPLSHAGAYTQHGGFRLRACVDPDEDRRQAFTRHWGVDRHAADLATLGAEPGAFDVISICSPTSLHHEHLAQALALRSRVIFCEKPLTSDMATAARLVRDCGQRSVTLVVNYSRRWDPALVELVAQLQEGHWGAVRSVVGHYNKGILNNGGHMVDLLLRLVGPLELVTTACAEFDFWESDPTVAALLTAQDGKVPVYLNPAHARDFAYFELELVCELGVVRMQSGGMGWQLRDAVLSPQFAGYRSLDAARQVEGRYLETMMRAMSDIYAHLQSGAPVGSSGVDALRVQELCMQIQREALMKCAPRT
jgi:predicted dehydrogenase